MSGKFEEYETNVNIIESESHLENYAKKSFEPFSNNFISGEPIREYYEKKLNELDISTEMRTPLQRERDRIVHSPQLRSLAEKFHVLYFEDQKISRNFITHVMRMAQITRAICRGLKLNQDFAEAIALGCKVGCLPFPYLAKETISKWAEGKLQSLDKDAANKGELPLIPTERVYPAWFNSLGEDAKSKILSSVPVAKMAHDSDNFYSSGKQSFWLLAFNSYELVPLESKWQKETMYGIWRHSLAGSQKLDATYQFDYEFSSSGIKYSLSYCNDTYEAMVVRLADDITWLIENLQDANQARMIATKGKGRDLLDELGASSYAKWPNEFLQGLARKNFGEIYNFFINDCINTTLRNFQEAGADDLLQRIGLRENPETKARVELSAEAFDTLLNVRRFLFENVFSDARTDNRNKVLRTILEFVADLLYGDESLSLPEITKEKIAQRSVKYPPFEANKVIKAAGENPFLRLQITINLMSEMTDKEIYSIVGMGEI